MLIIDKRTLGNRFVSRRLKEKCEHDTMVSNKPSIACSLLDELSKKSTDEHVLYIVHRNDVGIQHAKTIFNRVKSDLSLLNRDVTRKNVELVLQKFDALKLLEAVY